MIKNDTPECISAGNYAQVTELPYQRATSEQLSMMYTRYRWASGFVIGKSILEIACGGGIGLAYLAQKSNSVCGIDLDSRNLEFARQTCKKLANVSLELGDAHHLSLADRSFDVVILFDSVYFLRDAERVFDEALRVLRPGGFLLVSTVNKHWKGFNPSPQGVRYFGGEELMLSLDARGCSVETFGAFRTEEDTLQSHLVSAARRFAVKFRLIPTQVRYKEMLKRLFIGKLVEFGTEVKDGMAKFESLVSLNGDSLRSGEYKILYFAARKAA